MKIRLRLSIKDISSGERLVKKNYVWIVLLLSTLLLVACNKAEEESSIEEIEEVEDLELLSDEKIKGIVLNNLNQLEESVAEDFDEMLMAKVVESVLDTDKNTEEVEKLVEMTKEKFKNLVSTEKMDEWVRMFLYSSYVSLHKEYLNSTDIHARFEVVYQSEDSFEVTFISLADDAFLYEGRTNHLHYVKENGHWVFQKAEFFNTQEKPFNLTFEDLGEYHAKFDEINPEVLAEFEAIEEVEVAGESYLIFKTYDRYNARNTIDSKFNTEVAELYNSQKESSEAVDEGVHEETDGADAEGEVDTGVQNSPDVENDQENKTSQFNELPLETQFVVVNSVMDSRMLGYEVVDGYINLVTYYTDIQRLSYQVHSGVGSGHPINYWTIYEDSVVFEVAYMGQGAGHLVRQLPENEEVATIQKADLFELYLRLQNEYDIWAEKVEIEFADESEEDSEERFDEFEGTTSTEIVDVPSADILKFIE